MLLQLSPVSHSTCVVVFHLVIQRRPCSLPSDPTLLCCSSLPVLLVLQLLAQWVEVFDGLSGHIFEALLNPGGVLLALGLLRSFLHGSQLRDAALRYRNRSFLRLPSFPTLANVVKLSTGRSKFFSCHSPSTAFSVASLDCRTISGGSPQHGYLAEEGTVPLRIKVPNPSRLCGLEQHRLEPLPSFTIPHGRRVRTMRRSRGDNKICSLNLKGTCPSIM